jgi:hypothetical protein
MIEVIAEKSDAVRQDQTTHSGLLPAEETWSLTDEYLTIQYVDLQELSA